MKLTWRKDEHDRNEHSCIMENHCIYHPEAGPEGETGAGGLCPDCMDEGYVSYFCSQACYARNLVSIFFGFEFFSLQVKWRINGT